MKTERLLLIDIETGERLRAIDPAKVSGLKASIAEIGLRTPVTVVANQDGGDWTFRLIAGAHRLEALRQLGEEFVDAFVMEGDEDDAALWEIDENFARAELSDAQRAEHHVRREDILDRKGLIKTTKGPSPVGEKSSLTPYAKQASETLGVSKRTVEKDLARGKNIDPEILAEVAGSELDKGVILDELAKAPRAQQPALLDEIRARREAHKINAEHNRVIALTDAEQFANWIMERADLAELSTIISWLEGTKPKDVIAALRREAA